MVLELFIWGAWLPLIFGYLPSLGFSDGQQSWILNAFAIGAIVAMFFSNQFADRRFAAEKFMAVSHLVGGLAILALGFIKPPPPLAEGVVLAAGQAHPQAPFMPFFLLMLVHCLFYVPTLSIANGIAFAHLKDARKDYGIVRMGGTVGWILAAWPFVFIMVDWAKVPALHDVGLVKWLGAAFGTSKSGAAFQEGVRWTYIVAGFASLALAAFSLTLPHTPPKPQQGEKFAWLEAMKLLAKPFVLLLFIITFFDAFVHNLYFAWTGTFLAERVGIPGNWVMPVMSIGQIAEILTMAVLSMVLVRLGWRWTMVIGVLGHAVRFAIYAMMPDHPGIIIAVQILHGICYAFFFATLYIFVDEHFPKDIRTSAQGLFNMLVFGLGPLASFYVGPMLKTLHTVAGTTGAAVQYEKLFLYPCAIALFAAVLLAIAFHPPKEISTAAAIAPAL